MNTSRRWFLTHLPLLGVGAIVSLLTPKEESPNHWWKYDSATGETTLITPGDLYIVAGSGKGGWVHLEQEEMPHHFRYEERKQPVIITDYENANIDMNFEAKGTGVLILDNNGTDPVVLKAHLRRC